MMYPIRECDENGNETYFKSSNGFERWTEYDKKGNEIHYKDSEGYELWIEYDDKGNDICSLTFHPNREISTGNKKQFSDKLKRKYKLLLLRRKK